jgi:hypothetical protein
MNVTAERQDIFYGVVKFMANSYSGHRVISNNFVVRVEANKVMFKNIL